MKNKLFIPTVLFLGIGLIILPFFLSAQEKVFPQASLYTLRGEMLSTRDIRNDDQPLLLVFWKMSDRKSFENLESLYHVFNDSTLINTVKMIAICEDEGGSHNFIESLIVSRNFEIEVYIDKNGDFRRALGVIIPHTLLYDSKMNIYCRQQGYCAGNQDILCKEIRKCLAEVR